MRVDHRRRQARVPEGLLHEPDFPCFPVEPGGEGVPRALCSKRTGMGAKGLETPSARLKVNSDGAG